MARGPRFGPRRDLVHPPRRAERYNDNQRVGNYRAPALVHEIRGGDDTLSPDFENCVRKQSGLGEKN